MGKEPVCRIQTGGSLLEEKRTSGGGLGPLVPPSFFVVGMSLINLDSLTLRFIYVYMHACTYMYVFNKVLVLCKQCSKYFININIFNYAY